MSPEGAAPLGFFDKWTSEFEVPQHVIIHSKWLRVPELVVCFLIISIYVVGSFTLHLGFAMPVETSASVWTQVTQNNVPSSCWAMDLCNPNDEGTHDGPADYCKQNYVENMTAPAGVEHCVSFFGENSLLRSLQAEAVTIGTAVRFVQNQTVLYNDHVEELSSIKFLARVRDINHQPLADLWTAPGAVSYINESMPRSFPTLSDASIWSGNKTRPDPVYEGAQECGGLLEWSSSRTHSCMQTEWGNYITLGVLLEAAGVSLNDKGSETNLRTTGAHLDLDVYFTNMDGFWTWPFGFKTQYIVSPRVHTYIADGVPPEEFWPTYVRDEDGEFHAVSARGVRVTVTVRSKFGMFSLSYALGKIAVASIIFGFAKKFVSEILTRVYLYSDVTRHIGLLHNVSRFEHSRVDNDVKDLLEDGQNVRRSKLFMDSIV